MIPRISIAMPIYNAGRFLRPALKSLLIQTVTDWELLLIDDGSTDNALETVTDLLADNRIHVTRDGRNKGLAARLNEAIDTARGDFIARMDQDDISYPERFAKQLAALQTDPQLDLIACRCLRIADDNQPVGVIPFVQSHAELCAMSWRGIHLAHPAWMGRAAWFRKHRYAQPGPYFCEDQELLLRAAHCSTYAAIPEVLFAYRVRDSLLWRKTLRTRRAMLSLQIRHFVGHIEFGYAALAIMAFGVNCLRDAIAATLRLPPHANGAGAEMDTLAKQFAIVRDSVST
ncbi:MAG: putative glycosyltransferase EpsE [Rhodocyclales bacterium]|nr:putative glycosyltransferase EpsE [Rhodocyclales bacterium]